MYRSRNEQVFSVYAGGGKLAFIDDIRIERSLQNQVHGLSFCASASEIGIRAGDKIEVLWQDKKDDAIFSGYAEGIEVELCGGRGAKFDLRVKARSYAADLIDSITSFETKEKNLEEIAREVCGEFGVSVIKHKNLKLETAVFRCECQSPFQVLNSLINEQGGILACNGDGKVELAMARSELLDRHTLTLEDMSGVKYSQDTTDCFHEYCCNINGERETVTDGRIRKARITEQGSNSEDKAKVHAQLTNERDQRFGLSQVIDFSLCDWQIPGYETHWYENTNIVVDIPRLGLNKREFFVYGVVLSLSKHSGYRADLSCCNRSAFLRAKIAAESAQRGAASQKGETHYQIWGYKHE